MRFGYCKKWENPFPAMSDACKYCFRLEHEHPVDLTAERDKLRKENIHLSKMANYYRTKCKVYGGVLAQDGPLPTEFDLSLLKELNDELRGG